MFVVLRAVGYSMFTRSEGQSTHYNYQFDEGPKGPKSSWDYMSETSKCYTGNTFHFAQITAN